MPDAFAFVLIALAAYRVARGITLDSLFDGTRERVKAWAYTEDRDPVGRVITDRITGEPIMVGKTLVRGKLGDLATCPFCIGAYAAVAAILAWEHGGEVGRWIVFGFAAAGVQTFLQASER